MRLAELHEKNGYEKRESLLELTNRLVQTADHISDQYRSMLGRLDILIEHLVKHSSETGLVFGQLLKRLNEKDEFLDRVSRHIAELNEIEQKRKNKSKRRTK